MSAPTSAEDRKQLLALARTAIRDHLHRAARAPVASTGVLARRTGAFVTLTVGGELRGCIGHTGDEQPLSRLVPQCAIAAASEDPRFPPMGADELARVVIEVSLLGPVEPVADIHQIEVGRHGLIVEQAGWRGLLLPQVASERGWDRETFLSHTCLKAGLPRDAWKLGARVFKFEAEVFGEDE